VQFFLDSRFGAIENPAAGCIELLDGVPTPCSWINRMGQSGALQLKVGNTRYDIQMLGDSTAWVNAWEEYFIPGRGFIGFDANGAEQYDAGTTGIRNVGYFVTIPGGGVPLLGAINTPQNPGVAVDTQGIRKYLEEFLSKDPCGTFVKDLIHQLSANTGRSFKSDNLLDLFDRITGATEGGIVRAGSTPGGLGQDSSGRWQVQIGQNYSPPQTALDRRVINYSDAQVVLHELVHYAAAVGFYSDPEAATAAAKVLQRNDAPKREDYVGDKAALLLHDTSAYFDSRLREKCPSSGVH